jgi:aspartyl-tRNA(Asn)/glutamyl-tRNA(Gln) amidotransferase subunit B
MRSKEEAHDYRYFPCPDLLPLEIEQAWVDDIAASLPELPDEKKARFVGDYGLTEYDAGVLTAERAAADFFEDVARGRDGKAAANWVINELFGRLKKAGIPRDRRQPGDPAQLGGDHHAHRGGRHLRQDRQGPVRDRLHRGRRPGGDRRGPRHETGDRHRRHREGVVDEIIADNPAQVEKARQNPKLAGWFVGPWLLLDQIKPIGQLVPVN